MIVDILGERLGRFDNYEEGDTIASPLWLSSGSLSLTLTYQAGDGNDVAIVVIPEPHTFVLLGMGVVLLARRR